MSTDEAGADRNSASEQTTVLPETASQLVELERLQQALAESEERAKSHWAQYLRAVADLDNVRKRAAKDIEAANRYGLEKFAQELLPVRDSLELAVQNAEKAADVRSLKQGQEATLQLLAKALDVPKARLRILSGATSRLKQIAVDGDPARLGEALRKLTAAKSAKSD